jgi:hypothetical protein
MKIFMKNYLFEELDMSILPGEHCDTLLHFHDHVQTSEVAYFWGNKGKSYNDYCRSLRNYLKLLGRFPVAVICFCIS